MEGSIRKQKGVVCFKQKAAEIVVFLSFFSFHLGKGKHGSIGEHCKMVKFKSTES